MPDGDIYELTVDQTFSLQNISNVHHFVQIGTDGSGNAREALGDVWETEFKAAFLALVVADLTVVQLRIRRILPTQTQQFITPIIEDGDVAFNGLPPQQCAILRQLGTRSGRKGTGHMKISGVPVTSVENGRITAAYATDMNTLGDVYAETHTDAGTGFTFRAIVLGTSDNVAREIQKAGSTSRIKTVYSRTIGVGQ